jgi:hypothetical protein
MYKAKEEKRGLLTSEQQETLRKRAKQTYLLYDILSHLIFLLIFGNHGKFSFCPEHDVLKIEIAKQRYHSCHLSP